MAALFNSLDAVGNFLREKKLPFAKNSIKPIDADFSVSLSVVPDGAFEMKDVKSLTIQFNVDPTDIGNEDCRVECKAILDKSSKMEDFEGSVVTQEESDVGSVKDIISMCDSDLLFNSNLGYALDILGSRIPEMASLYRRVRTKRSDRLSTLGVAYNKTMGYFEMLYNPSFVLLAALEEWGGSIDSNGASKRYKDFKECYIFAFAYLLAHEMSHIIRHNTDSSIGTMDTDEHDHNTSNMIEDSYINFGLQSVFKGIIAGTAQSLSVGYCSDISFRSHMKQGGFKKFKTYDEVAREVMKLYLNIVRLKNIGYQFVNNVGSMVDISNLEKHTCFLRFHISSIKVFNNSITMYEVLVNKILRALVNGPILGASQGRGEDEIDRPPTDPTQAPPEAPKETLAPDKGDYIGMVVKDAKTGKYGVINGIDDAGELTIIYVKDLEQAKLVIDLLCPNDVDSQSVEDSQGVMDKISKEAGVDDEWA